MRTRHAYDLGGLFACGLCDRKVQAHRICTCTCCGVPRAVRLGGGADFVLSGQDDRSHLPPGGANGTVPRLGTGIR